jgi:hypothetical protein
MEFETNTNAFKNLVITKFQTPACRQAGNQIITKIQIQMSKYCLVIE